MQHRIGRTVAAAVCGVALGASSVAFASTMVNPKISHAITALQNAQGYLKSAPHDFNGHRQDALNATDAAIKQLNIIIQYDK
jgi:Spy/CpxP family protein refolding chaperone